MEKEIHVYIDLDGISTKVGDLWVHSRHGKESCSFEYDRLWLASENRFSLDPALKLAPGSFHASQDKPLFGAIEDSAPDRWGRTLMRRAERKNALNEKRQARSLGEIDFLLMVDDEARLGALRFKYPNSENFLTTYEGINHIPPLISINKLLHASQNILEDTESDEDLRLLLAPGSSLGGARPKATIRDKDGHLAIAKFSKKNDEIDVIGWEAVALTLADMAKIAVPEWRLEKVGKERILISRRFDRKDGKRIPFLSAMSALMAQDGHMHSYLEIGDAIRQLSASPKEDLHALWRRIVFNIFISNVDDHLRNHAFLYSGLRGWRLSPAYDLNPTPADIRPKILSTAIDYSDPTASLHLALETSRYYDLTIPERESIVQEVASATAKWRDVAKQYKISPAEINRMVSAFES
ncbi:MAG: type II toxin-antitoxin system HipA family toxin [Chlamydiales bacterium]|nr:type II toxin-antitoxin system HipA family toxin [Chlamydiales bacterium]